MNAAELFVKCLENERVEYIFGVPGEETSILLADDMVAVVDCPVDYSENMKLTEKLANLVSPV